MAMKLLFGISTDDNYSSEKQNNLGHRQFQWKEEIYGKVSKEIRAEADMRIKDIEERSKGEEMELKKCL
jgi:hypothetical protein